MSYATFEESDSSGQPLELYRFSVGARQWLFTSADHEVVISAEEKYQPVYIKRGGFSKGGDARRSTMDIEINAANDVALLFRDGWLAGTVIVTIFRLHHGDSEKQLFWKGRITGCKWAGSVATLSSDSAFTLFKRAGLRRVYQVGCPHVLYSAACGINADARKVVGTVMEVIDGRLTVDGLTSFASGYFLGGMLQAGTELRMINGHDGATITMVDAIGGLVAGTEVTLWPGCRHDMNDCGGKFNNIVNYGGLPYLPTKNPFSGDALV